MSFSFNSKMQLLKSGISTMAWLLLSFHPCLAQYKGGLPDSISVNDTVPLSDNANSESGTIAVDSIAAPGTITEDRIELRTVPDSVPYADKKNKDFAYANDPEYWMKPRDKGINKNKNFMDYFLEWLNTRWVRGFVIVLLLSILLFAVYKIVLENKLYMFYSPPKKNSAGDVAEADLSIDDMEKKILEATLSNDLRLALRYMYLKLLKTAGDRELIRLHTHGTNQEYIRQLIGHPQSNNFIYLTNAYEYVWYGGFQLTPEQFESLQKRFDNFYKAGDY